VLVTLLDQEPAPAVPIAAGPPAQPYEHPAAVKFLARERELQLAGAKPGFGIAHGRPGAPIPEENRAAPVLSLGDDALEASVLERVILGLHGEALVGRIEARPLRDCPAREDAADLQTEVVVKASRIVLLDHECRATALRGRATSRLRGAGEVALAVIGGERRLARGSRSAGGGLHSDV
jgi:hypothetical protein